MEGRPLQGHRGSPGGPRVHTGQGQARSRARGWGSPHDQASWGLLGCISRPSPPHSATQVSQTRQDPHLGPHTAAGLARLKLELCPPIPLGPLPLPGLPERFDSLWGHPSLPHPRAHERWVGSKHRTAMPSAVGSPGDAGALRGLPLHEASMAPEAACSRNGAPRWSLGGSRTRQSEGGGESRLNATDAARALALLASRLTSTSPTVAGSLGTMCRSTHMSTDHSRGFPK